MRSEYIKGFFKAAVFHPAVILMSCGAVFGMVTSIVAIYSTYDSMNQNCDRYTTKVACTSVKFTVCKWDAGNNKCIFHDADCKAHKTSESDCKSYSSSCYWNYKDKTCSHFTGMKPTALGIYAGSMTLGGTIGSLAGGTLCRLFGRKKNIIGVGVLGLFGTVLEHIARIANSYALHIISRIFQGISAGSACIVGPLYVDEMVPKDYLSSVSNMFQMSICFGIAIGATFGLGFEPRGDSKKQWNEARIHIIFLVQDIICLNALFQGLFARETPTYLRMKALAKQKKENKNNLDEHNPTIEEHFNENEQQEEAEEKTVQLVNDTSPPKNHGDDAAKEEEAVKEDTVLVVQGNEAGENADAGEAEAAKRDLTDYTFGQLLMPYSSALWLAIVLQFTGINAIMNYAPSMTGQLGLEKMLGNFIIMLWNWLSTIISIPLASRVTLRLMFLWGTMGTALSNLVVAIPTYPHVASSSTQDAANIIAFIGILLFIFSFEAAIGPPFYPLLIRLFPYSARTTGSTFGNGLQMFFNLLINVFFPILVQAFSGGPSGNQKKGMAIVFFIFAGFGVVSFFYHLKFLTAFYPWDNAKDKEGQAAAETMENVEREREQQPNTA